MAFLCGLALVIIVGTLVNLLGFWHDSISISISVRVNIEDNSHSDTAYSDRQKEARSKKKEARRKKQEERRKCLTNRYSFFYIFCWEGGLLYPFLLLLFPFPL